MSLALTRQPSPKLSTGAELTFIARDHLDQAKAESQHLAYRAALADAGLTLLQVPPLDDCPDGCFIEDPLLALPEMLILTRPGTETRRQEVASLTAILPQDRPLHSIMEPGTLEGGDVLLLGRVLHVGLSTRSNAAGLAQLAALVEPHGYMVRAVPVPGALHLKTAVTAPRPGLVVLNPAWIAAEAFAGQEQIAVDPAEPFAGNVLPLPDGRVLVPAAHMRMADRLDALGLKVQRLDISEFAKAEAGLTCLSVLIPPAKG